MMLPSHLMADGSHHLSITGLRRLVKSHRRTIERLLSETKSRLREGKSSEETIDRSGIVIIAVDTELTSRAIIRRARQGIDNYP